MLAVVFLVALLVDPSQPVRSSPLGYALLLGYAIFALAMLVIAWRSWWFDLRLAPLALAIDTLAFLAAVYFTEGRGDDFTSPFLAFFAFLMLSATIRWDWHVTAATGAVVTALYLATGLVMVGYHIDIDVYRFGRRVTYMAVLAMVLIWIGLQRRDRHVGRFFEPFLPLEGSLPPLEEALAYAMEQVGASRGAIVWAANDDPEIEMRSFGIDPAPAQVDPGMFDPAQDFGTRVRLFDSSRTRRIVARQVPPPLAERGYHAEPVADFLGIGDGLALPVTAGTGRGQIVLGGIAGAAADHVEMGHTIAREIAAAFDRVTTLQFAREAAVLRTRESLARDLHDTVAQSLAGTTMRLAALRQWVAEGNDPEVEILAVKRAVQAEQQQVREMIERLRDSRAPTENVPIDGAISRLLPQLASHWGVEASFNGGCECHAGEDRVQEIRLILREAFANAVRHGGAGSVAVATERDAKGLVLEFSDDGNGFPSDWTGRKPRSIAERVARLGGSFEIASSPKGATLLIHLPLEE